MSFTDDIKLTKSECKCKTCTPPTRYPGCHSVCEDYIKWRKELDEANKKIKEQQELARLARPSKPVKKRRMSK